MAEAMALEEGKGGVEYSSREDDPGVLSDGAVPFQDKQHSRSNMQTGTENIVQSAKSAFGKIIIIVPQGSDEIRKKFVGQSIALSKLLKSSVFAQAGIENLRTNFAKCSVSIEIKTGEMMGELIKT